MEVVGMLYDAIVVSCIFGVLLLAWNVFNWVWLTPKRIEKVLRQQGFRGNPYRPVVGDLNETTALIAEAKSKPINISHDIVPRVMPDVYKTFQKYGKKSYLWIGRMPKVLVFDPELMREILANHNVFVKNFKAHNPLTQYLLTGVGSYEGEKWARHRRIISPSFHLEKLKLMLPAFYVSYSELLGNWAKECEEKGSCEVDLFPTFDTLTSDVISRTAFGSSYDEGGKIFVLLKELMDLTIEAMRSVYIPGWSLLPTKTNNRMRAIEKELRSMLGIIINKRVKALKAGGANEDDLLGTLLESNLKEIQEQGNKKNAGMSLEDVIQECKLFYFAGQETTGILLTWTMICLSMSPKWQDVAREEIYQLFGKGKPDFERVNNLKYVTAILYEVLRLYPPVVDLTKIVDEDTKLGNNTIPAGVQIMMPSLMIHRDKEIWGEDAMEFNPERFAEGVAKATLGNVTYLPFSWGPRMCLGQNFALLQAKLALSMILQRFSVELSPTYAHAPYTVLTLQPQTGSYVVFREI